MKIFPPLVCIFLLGGISPKSFGQYEGLDSTRRQSSKNMEEAPFADEINAYRYKDLAYHGLDFSTGGGGGIYNLEVAPYTGVHFNDRFYAAVGVTTSIISNNFTGNISTIAGVYSFVRVPISSLFLHAEYRYQNSLVSFNPRERAWIGVPIIGGGYNNDGRLGIYALVGVALNPKFSYSNSLGVFIYRFGFRF